MLEILIIGMCLGDYECDQLLRAYKQTPTGKQINSNAKEMVIKATNKETLAVLGTAYAAASNRKLKLRLYKGLTITGNHDKLELVYKFTF